jgi:hypothetical protein
MAGFLTRLKGRIPENIRDRLPEMLGGPSQAMKNVRARTSAVVEEKPKPNLDFHTSPVPEKSPAKPEAASKKVPKKPKAPMRPERIAMITSIAVSVVCGGTSVMLAKKNSDLADRVDKLEAQSRMHVGKISSVTEVNRQLEKENAGLKGQITDLKGKLEIANAETENLASMRENVEALMPYLKKAAELEKQALAKTAAKAKAKTVSKRAPSKLVTDLVARANKELVGMGSSLTARSSESGTTITYDDIGYTRKYTFELPENRDKRSVEDVLRWTNDMFIRSTDCQRAFQNGELIFDKNGKVVKGPAWCDSMKRPK